MAQVRNVSGQALFVPELRMRVVEPDEIITVPDTRVEGYTCQPATWEAVSPSAPVITPPSQQNLSPAELPPSQA
jgi:hypothetical protein